MAGARPFEHGSADGSQSQAHLHLAGNCGKGIVIGRGDSNDGVNFRDIAASAGKGALRGNHSHINQRLVFRVGSIDEARGICSRHPAAQIHGAGAHVARTQARNTLQVVGAAWITQASRNIREKFVGDRTRRSVGTQTYQAHSGPGINLRHDIDIMWPLPCVAL